MNVRWTETATNHVTAIRDYLARSSSGYADVVAERIVRRTETLADFPFLGAEVPEYGDEAIREVFEHPYRILYRVHEDEVQIIGVIHAARQLPRHPPG